MSDAIQEREVLAVTLWLITGDTMPAKPADLSALCEEWRNDEKLRERWRAKADQFSSLAEESGLRISGTAAKVSKAIAAILTVPARRAYSL